MIFVPKLYNNYTIEREVVEDIGRHYRVTLDTGESHLLPSMTTILHQEEPEYITAWRNRVGEKTADSISRYATDAGTELHEFCENVLLRNAEKARYVLDNSERMSKFYMKKILPYLKKINKVYATEEFLFDLDIGIAGTVDGVVEYNGKICVLDFKTANMPRNPDDIENYYIQACGYSQLWKYLTGETINDIMILLVNSINVQEISVKSDMYYDKFIKTVENYYDKHSRN